MLDKEFIIKIANEKLNMFVGLNLKTLEDNFQDPSYNWLQRDPDNKKKEFLMQEIYNDTIQLMTCKTAAEQRVLIKNIIYQKIQKVSNLVFLLMMALPKIFELADLKDPYVQKKIDEYINTIPAGSDLRSQDYKNLVFRYYNQSLTRDQLDCFFEFLLSSEKWLIDYGITTSEKNFKNCSLITQFYSINNLSNIIFQECALSLGISGIKDNAQMILTNVTVEIREFIKKIDPISKKLNKIEFKDQVRMYKNILLEKNFLKDD